MENARVVRGRLVGPRQIELDESLPEQAGDIAVIVLPIGETRPGTESVFAFLRRLSPGARSKEDIDRQVREERGSWGDR